MKSKDNSPTLEAITNGSNKRVKQFSAKNANRSYTSFKGVNKICRVVSQDQHGWDSGQDDASLKSTGSHLTLGKVRSIDSLSRRRAKSSLSMVALSKTRSGNMGNTNNNLNMNTKKSLSSSALLAGTADSHLHKSFVNGIKPEENKKVEKYVRNGQEGLEFYTQGSSTDEEVDTFTDEDDDKDDDSSDLPKYNTDNNLDDTSQKVHDEFFHKNSISSVGNSNLLNSLEYKNIESYSIKDTNSKNSYSGTQDKESLLSVIGNKKDKAFEDDAISGSLNVSETDMGYNDMSLNQDSKGGFLQTEDSNAHYTSIHELHPTLSDYHKTTISDDTSDDIRSNSQDALDTLEPLPTFNKNRPLSYVVPSSFRRYSRVSADDIGDDIGNDRESQISQNSGSLMINTDFNNNNKNLIETQGVKTNILKPNTHDSTKPGTTEDVISGSEIASMKTFNNFGNSLKRDFEIPMTKNHDFTIKNIHMDTNSNEDKISQLSSRQGSNELKLNMGNDNELRRNSDVAHKESFAAGSTVPKSAPSSKKLEIEIQSDNKNNIKQHPDDQGILQLSLLEKENKAQNYTNDFDTAKFNKNINISSLSAMNNGASNIEQPKTYSSVGNSYMNDSHGGHQFNYINRDFLNSSDSLSTLERQTTFDTRSSGSLQMNNNLHMNSNQSQHNNRITSINESQESVNSNTLSPATHFQNSENSDFSSSISSLANHLQRPVAKNRPTLSSTQHKSSQSSLLRIATVNNHTSNKIPAQYQKNGSLDTSTKESTGPKKDSDNKNQSLLNDFSLFLKSDSNDAESRTQQKLWLQRENSILDLTADLSNSQLDSVFMASSVEAKREFERISREYVSIKRYHNPLYKSLQKLQKEVSGKEKRISTNPKTDSSDSKRFLSSTYDSTKHSDNEIISEISSPRVENLLREVWNKETQKFLDLSFNTSQQTGHGINNMHKARSSTLMRENSSAQLYQPAGRSGPLYHSNPRSRGLNSYNSSSAIIR